MVGRREGGKEVSTDEDVEGGVEFGGNVMHELVAMGGRGDVTEGTINREALMSPLLEALVQLVLVPRAGVHGGAQVGQLLHHGMPESQR